jgi:flagellar biosynthetic protein FlhB
MFGRSLGEVPVPGKALDLAAVRGSMLAVFYPTIPFLLIPAAIAALVGLAQAGFRFRPESLCPNVGRFAGLRVVRQVVGGSAATAALFATAKWSVSLFLVVWWIWWEVCRSRAGEIPVSPAAMELHAGMPLRVTIKLAFLLVGLGLLDYLWTWAQHVGQMRMTRAELTAEMRETEGDPTNRRRVRQKRVNRALVKWEKLLQPGDLLLVGHGRLAMAIRTVEDEATLLAKAVGTVADTLERVAHIRSARVLRHAVLARRIAERCEAGKRLPAELVRQLMEIERRQADKLTIPV